MYGPVWNKLNVVDLFGWEKFLFYFFFLLHWLALLTFVRFLLSISVFFASIMSHTHRTELADTGGFCIIFCSNAINFVWSICILPDPELHYPRKHSSFAEKNQRLVNQSCLLGSKEEQLPAFVLQFH